MCLRIWREGTVQNPATEASVGVHFLEGKGSTGQGTEELSRNEIEESEESCPRGQTWQCRMGWDSVETQWGFGKNSLQWAHVGIKA